MVSNLKQNSYNFFRQIKAGNFKTQIQTYIDHTKTRRVMENLLEEKYPETRKLIVTFFILIP